MSTVADESDVPRAGEIINTSELASMEQKQKQKQKHHFSNENGKYYGLNVAVIFRYRNNILNEQNN